MAGHGGVAVNSRGTTLMIDPLLRDFDMPIMIEMPIAAAEVPRLDAVFRASATPPGTSLA